MAHDVTFTQNGTNVFFFGYAKGIFYEMFDCKKYDAGVSGSGGTIQVDFNTCSETVAKICKSPTALNYPDKNRFPDFQKEFDKKFSETDGIIKITFS